MTISSSARPVRAGVLALAGGLLLGVVPAAVTAGSAHAATPTSMTLRATATTVTAGAKLELLAHLSVAGKQVTFAEAYRGQAAHVIFRGATDGNGDLLIGGIARYSSTYSVTFAGDTTYGASSARVTTTVRAKLAIKASGGAKRKGYRLYRQSKKAKLAAAVAPSKTGRRVLFRLQVRRGKHWRTIDTRRYTLRKGSAVAITYRGKAGKRYRVRAEYAGDTLNAGNHSTWTYSRFRR